MSLFNANDGASQAREQVTQRIETKRVTKFAESDNGKAVIRDMKRMKAERDALQREKDEHAAQFPDCGKRAIAKPNECQGCGIFYIPGPIPCQGCGYSPATGIDSALKARADALEAENAELRAMLGR